MHYFKKKKYIISIYFGRSLQIILTIVLLVLN